ncbi:MAG: DUF4252 domain-containing protein, partial [Bacteroidota bacterium]
MKRISIIALALLMSFAAFGQSKTIKQFEKDTDGYKLFLYQSVIRMLNKDKNPDFNMLIRNVDHLRFVSSEASGAEAMATFKLIDQGVREEGFGELMSFDNANNRCRVYERESKGGQSTWVITLYMEGVAAAMEMKGSLDLKYIDALASLNMDRVG